MSNTAPPSFGTNGHAGGIQKFKLGKNGRGVIGSKRRRKKIRQLYKDIKNFYKS